MTNLALFFLLSFIFFDEFCLHFQAAVLSMKLQLQPGLNMEEVSWIVVALVNVAVITTESSK